MLEKPCSPSHFVRNARIFTPEIFSKGPLNKVTLQCENRFAGAMIDRFGTGPTLVPCDDGEHFTMMAEVQVSPQFFGWVAGFGTGVVVAGPPEVRAEMKKTLDRLQDLYR